MIAASVWEIEQQLTDKQKKPFEEFKAHHKCKEFTTNSGGFGSTSRIAFIVGSCQIGPTLDLYCPYCKYIEDITDTDLW